MNDNGFPSADVDDDGKVDGAPIVLDGLTVTFHQVVPLSPVDLKEKRSGGQEEPSPSPARNHHSEAKRSRNFNRRSSW